MAKLDLGALPVRAPVVRKVTFAHPLDPSAEVTLCVRKPDFAALLAIREAARADIDEWVTVKTLPDGSFKRPNVFQLHGKVVPMSEGLWQTVNALFALQCGPDGGRLPEAERYSKKEWIEFSQKLEPAFIELGNAAGELVNLVGEETKNSSGASEEPGSAPSPAAEDSTPS